MKYILSLVCVSSAISFSAFAESESPDNPIIKYYESHYSAAKAEVKIAESKIAAALANRTRLSELVKTRAASMAEYDKAIMEAEIAALKKEAARLASEEKRIFLKIAENRLSLGVNMPICGLSR